jgi:glucuronoarabinoxylan endo-1,4-beta-xylanase
LGSRASVTTGTESAFETSAFIKGDSIIVMAIDTTATARDIRIRLPYEVQSGVQIVSTSNESLCKQSTIEIEEPTKDITIPMAARSLNTYIFMIYHEETGIKSIDNEQLTMDN